MWSFITKKDTTGERREGRVRAVKTKSVKVLPKTAGEITNGGVYAQAVRCGKNNCKCSRGELHTAHYFFTRHNGSLIKLYVRKAEVAAFTALVNQATLERQQQRRSTNKSNRLLRQLRDTARQYEQLKKQYRGKL